MLPMFNWESPARKNPLLSFNVSDFYLNHLCCPSGFRSYDAKRIEGQAVLGYFRRDLAFETLQ
jgi:hypothetical protein